MKCRRSGLLCLLLALGSCGLDGGSSGTGITTAQGNIVSVQVAQRARVSAGGIAILLAAARSFVGFPAIANARTGVEDVQVSIEGTQLSARTDANGLFSIRGSFAGPVGLIFQRPDDGLMARAVINVPAGGTLTLNAVRVDGRRSKAEADSQTLDFKGQVAGTNCSGGTIALVSQQRPNDGNTYTIRVQGSDLHDAQGNSVECSRLRGAERVSCRGSVNERDGTIGEAHVEVEKEDSNESEHDGSDGESGSSSGDNHDDGTSESGSDGSSGDGSSDGSNDSGSDSHDESDSDDTGSHT